MMAGTRSNKRGSSSSPKRNTASTDLSQFSNQSDFTEDALLNLQTSIAAGGKIPPDPKTTNSSVKLNGASNGVAQAPPALRVVSSNSAPSTAATPNSSTTSISSAWKGRLKKSGKNGPVKKTLLNAAVPLRHAPEFANVFRYNSSALCIVIESPLPWDDRAVFSPRPWTDHDTLKYTEWLQSNGIDVLGRVASDAVLLVSQDHEFHPIKDYFESLKWDGTPRLDTWLVRYGNCIDTPYVRLVGPKFMISGVARIYNSGCKAECVLILIGEQGEKKSTLLQAIAGKEWFTDQIGFIGNKDASIALAGKLLVEFPDLDGFTGRSADELKAFFSRQSDRYRAPYGRLAEDHPRQTIFAGTTNLQTPLRDFTGNRRFWAVRVHRADTNALIQDRNQLWAEAVHRYKAGEFWWLETDEEKLIAEKEIEEYRDIDDWEDMIGGFLKRSKREEITCLEVLDKVFDIEPKAVTKAQMMRVGHCLHALGWRRKQIMRDGRRKWLFYPKGTMPQ